MTTLYFFLAVSTILSVLALWRPNYILAVVASVSCLGILWYTRDNPPFNITIGDTGDVLLIMICIGAALAILMAVIQRVKINTGRETTDIDEVEDKWDEIAKEARRERGFVIRQNTPTRYSENPEEYKARVHSLLHRKRRRR